VLETGTSDEARRLSGRHRAAPSGPRKLQVRGAVAVAGVLLAVVLGRTAAEAVGLTGAPPLGDAVVPGRLLADPTFPRTVDITATPAPRTARAPATDADVASRAERPAPTSTGAAVAAAEPAPQSETARAPAPAQVPAARPGDACPAEGVHGATAKGRPLVCTASRGGDRLRWRRG
jgi:hypothetical protein